MKALLLFFMLSIALKSHSQDNLHKPVVLHYGSFYLLCRGTQQKMGLIADRFNLNDPYSTHVGIGLVEKGILIVYSVNNDTYGKTALVREKLDSFVGGNDVLYWSVWQCKTSARELSILKKVLYSYRLKKIVFDMDFEANNNKFYCSEFCATVLKKINPEKFSFPLTQKPLDAIFAAVLRKNTLHYYPVDFFQNSDRIRKIYEVHR